MEEIIKVNNLTFKYPNNMNLNIFENINFSINHNINVILGLNGAGKSTLLKIISGLEKKYLGEIIINNDNKEQELRKLSKLNKSKLISYVPQLQNENINLLVYDYLELSLYNHYKSSKQESLKILSKYIKKFEIENLIDKNYSQLSGGQKQIVNIIGAFIQDAKIIILDEPTSALDLEKQEKILNIIKKYEDKKIFIISTHNPNHALLLEAYVYLINENKIIKEGIAKEIITKNNMQNIYGDKICYANELEHNSISIKLKD